MPRTHHTLNHLTAAIALAAATAAIAAASASAAHTQEQTCAGPPTWATVIDDQGLPTLQQTSGTRCTSSLACPTTNDTTTPSPYQGWVNITDDTGVPWLYPASQTLASRQLACTTTAAPDTSPTQTQTPTATPATPITDSPYPGWKIVTDENGVPWLNPTSQTQP